MANPAAVVMHVLIAKMFAVPITRKTVENVPQKWHTFDDHHYITVNSSNDSNKETRFPFFNRLRNRQNEEYTT